MSDKWDDRFLAIAWQVSGWSKDPRTKVGAVAVRDRTVLATGYNGLPRGVEDLYIRMTPPDKYLFTCHAEANVVANAAAHGSALEGATVYVTHQPCAQCAALLINAGVRRVVAGDGKTNMPAEQFAASGKMFAEAGVEMSRPVGAGMEAQA